VTVCLTPLQVAVAQRLQQQYDLKRSGALPTSCPSGYRLGTVTKNGITSMGCVPAAGAAAKCPPGTMPRTDASGRIVGCLPAKQAPSGRAQCSAGYVEYFYGPNKDKSSCRPICPSGSLPSYDTSNVFVSCVGASQGTNPWLYDVNGNSEGRQAPGLGCPSGYSPWGANACRRDGAVVAASPAQNPWLFASGGAADGCQSPTPDCPKGYSPDGPGRCRRGKFAASACPKTSTAPAAASGGKEKNPLTTLAGLGALTKGPATLASTAMAPAYVWLRVTNRPVVLSNGRKGFYGVFSSDLATIQSVAL
jgi:hypothetical protein